MAKSSITTMKNAFDLTGRNAIVTGGNGGIGLGIAKCLAECGANIAIFCRNMEKAQGALQELHSIGGKHEVFACDVTDLKNVREAVTAAYNAFGNFDILVNNAGVTRGKPFLDWDENLTEWYVVLNTDLNGIVHTTFEVGKRMRDSGKGGSIVNITSNAGLMVNKGMNISAYSAAKAGANQFTKFMGVELAPYNIRVNAIAPGFIDDGFGKNLPPERVKAIEESQPIDRLGTVMEIGSMVCMLASDASNYTTGAVIVVDGGYSLSC